MNDNTDKRLSRITLVEVTVGMLRAIGNPLVAQLDGERMQE